MSGRPRLCRQHLLGNLPLPLPLWEHCPIQNQQIARTQYCVVEFCWCLTFRLPQKLNRVLKAVLFFFFLFYACFNVFCRLFRTCLTRGSVKSTIKWLVFILCTASWIPTIVVKSTFESHAVIDYPFIPNIIFLKIKASKIKSKLKHAYIHTYNKNRTNSCGHERKSVIYVRRSQQRRSFPAARTHLYLSGRSDTQNLHFAPWKSKSTRTTSGKTIEDSKEGATSCGRREIQLKWYVFINEGWPGFPSHPPNGSFPYIWINHYVKNVKCQKWESTITR